MKKIRFVFLHFVVFYIVLSAGTFSKAASETDDLLYLKKNFTRLYKQHPDRFWNILNPAAERIKTCPSVAYTANFIELIALAEGSGELRGFFGEAIQDFCISDPKCFFDTLMTISDGAKDKVVDLLVHSTPSHKKGIQEAVEKYETVPEYKDTIDTLLFLMDDSENPIAGPSIEPSGAIDFQKNEGQSINFEMDLEKEKEFQAGVEKGHPLWRTNPTVVTYLALRTAMDKNIPLRSLQKMDSTEEEARVKAKCVPQKDCIVHLKRLVKPDGIWTAISIETEPASK